ncbi:MAG: hypothetical protein ISS45_05950 [Candidatus Omnitrophica bacterium]|nr:hypothetical protein [Candidatus Omnitrophota bacterium]
MFRITPYYLTIEGPVKDIGRFRKAACKIYGQKAQDDLVFSFEKLLPTPKEFKEGAPLTQKQRSELNKKYGYSNKVLWRRFNWGMMEDFDKNSYFDEDRKTYTLYINASTMCLHGILSISRLFSSIRFTLEEIYSDDAFFRYLNLESGYFRENRIQDGIMRYEKYGKILSSDYRPGVKY